MLSFPDGALLDLWWFMKITNLQVSVLGISNFAKFLDGVWFGETNQTGA